jgi:hypothetical protein
VVDSSQIAQISDFGVNELLSDTAAYATTAENGSMARWMAPELLVGSAKSTPESDMYAFAMVCWEVRITVWFA